MKIGLLGTFMHDQIKTVGGETFESLGGTLYNLTALAVTLGGEGIVRPFTYLSWDHLQALKSGLFSRFNCIDDSALRVNATGTDSNILVYVTASSRKERMSIVTPPFDPEFINPVADCDAALVNFITGQEMDMETFRHLRRLVKGPIYFDVHNLGKQRKDGVPVPGHRFPGWPDWIRHVDMVQANEWEAERLLDVHPTKESDYREAAARFLEVEGPSVAVLTLGGEGCAMAWREQHGEKRFVRIPAMEHLRIVDTTGCGDSFSSGFLVEYLRTRDPLRSALFAATLSGMNCMVKGLDGLAQITGVREMMHQEYGELLAKVESGWRGEPI